MHDGLFPSHYMMYEHIDWPVQSLQHIISQCFESDSTISKGQFKMKSKINVTSTSLTSLMVTHKNTQMSIFMDDHFELS